MDIIDKTESEDTLEALGCDGTAVSKIMVFQNYLHHIICLSLVLVDINNTKYVVFFKCAGLSKFCIIFALLD